MTSTTSLHARSPRRRVAVALVSLALVASACGGGSDDSSDDDAPTTDAATAVTEPPPAEVEPIGTDAPVETAPPASDAPVDTTASTASPEAFCDASRDYAVAAGSLDAYSGDDDEGARRSFIAMQTRARAAIDAAPDDGAAAPPQEALTLLDELIPILDTIAFDPDRFSDLPDQGARASELITDFRASQDRLQFFLTDQCGFAAADIERDARSFAAANSTMPLQSEGGGDMVTTDPVVTPPSPSGDSVDIADDANTINVRVPAEWTDVDGAPGPTENRLVASTSVAGFLNGFSVPGMFIESVPTPDGNGSDIFPIALQTIVGNYEDGGCSGTVEMPYSDIAYTGTEAVLQCVPGFDTRVIAGTDSAGTTIFVVAMVLPDDDAATRQLIVDSFIV